MTVIARTKYGIVEPNHLTSQKTGQLLDQLPAASSITILENGQFLKYDEANGECNLTGAGPWYMVFNEVKLYEPRKFLKDYAMLKADCVDGIMVPRLIAVNVGDAFTTNMFADGVDLAKGDYLKVNASGLLEEASSATDAEFQVVAITTMPDGIETGVKIRKIA